MKNNYNRLHSLVKPTVFVPSYLVKTPQHSVLVGQYMPISERITDRITEVIELYIEIDLYSSFICSVDSGGELLWH